MSFSCMVCSGAASRPWLDECRDHFLGRPGLASYVQCVDCGLVQQHPIPSDLADLYEHYPIHEKKSRLHEWFRRRVFRYTYFDAALLPPQASVLDFGCGDGWYLDSLHGLNLRGAGYEFDGDHARRLSKTLGVPVWSDWSALETSTGPPFDAVTLHYVMEHLADPSGCLQKIRGVLIPNGLVYILLPNIHSWEARLFGRLWHGLDPPRHLSFPDRAVIARLAQAQGFELISTKEIAFPNTVAASLAVFFFGRFKQVAFLAFYPVGMLLSKMFPSGSVAYLLKKSS